MWKSVQHEIGNNSTAINEMKVLLTMILSFWVSISLGQNRVAQYLDSLGKEYNLEPRSIYTLSTISKISDDVQINLLEYENVHDDLYKKVDVFNILAVNDYTKRGQPIYHLILLLRSSKIWASPPPITGYNMFDDMDSLFQESLYQKTTNDPNLHIIARTKAYGFKGCCNEEDWCTDSCEYKDTVFSAFEFKNESNRTNKWYEYPYDFGIMASRDSSFEINSYYNAHIFRFEGGYGAVEVHFVPKIGIIRYDVYNAHHLFSSYRLRKINNILFEDFIRQDRCITSFCEIARFK